MRPIQEPVRASGRYSHLRAEYVRYGKLENNWSDMIPKIAAILSAVLLTAFAGEAAVTRGPYLQKGTPTSVVVKWRTDVSTDSRVRFGSSPTSLTSFADNTTVTTQHEVSVTGLTPDTLYYYSVGSTTATQAGGDTNHFFVTFPPAGNAVPTRIWVLGDSGTANASATAVKNAYLNATGTRHTDFWLMLGDNAYSSGTDTEYQNAVFNMYPTMLRKSVLFSTRGNHEADANVYYNIFTLPANGEGGGLPSGTEAYYSFDFGNIHFICLDSFGTTRSATGPMATWLDNDLAATTRDWIIAFWHHPPYTKGSHNSDTEADLIEMRQNLVPILENGGVDLVLCGHSHSYERSFLIDGHYGLSSTFSASNVKDGGSGRDATPYQKPAGLTPRAGAVYTVAGSSGQTSGGTLNHPAMFISLNVLGSVVLDFQTDRLDLSFLDSTGVVRDYFTITKGTVTPTAPAAPQNLAASGGNAQVSLTWNASSGATSYNVKRATVSGGPYTTIANVTTTSHVDTGVVNGTTYYYVVSALNAVGESANSSQVSATPSAPSPPAAPSNLTLTPGKRKMRLNWVDNSSNETAFKIERSTDGVNFTQRTTVGANIVTFQDSGLTSGVQYYYRVRATNASGDSAYSNTASAAPR
jgi:acid phosphatase type 7